MLLAIKNTSYINCFGEFFKNHLTSESDVRRFSCQLHQPLAWREFVARIDSLYCNYLIWCASSNSIFFISIFYQQDNIALYLLSASVILTFCGDFWVSSVSSTTTTCVTHGKEKTEGSMVSCRQPRLGKWRGATGKKNIRKYSHKI